VAAPGPPPRAAAGRRVRLELIRFLIAHDQPGRAIAELLAAAADLPDQPNAHDEVAQLFFQAGDYRRSLEHFQRALRLAADDDVALAGAGQSAFRLGEYPLARSYLHRAPPGLDNVAATLEIVGLVMADDPLAPRIGSAERRRRLVDDLAYVRQQVDTCVRQQAAPETTSKDSPLRAEAEAFTNQLRRASVLDQDTLENGVDIVAQFARAIVQGCASPSARDRALVLIGRQHNAAAK
jgi:tetratricopeptide (TPR) repeat protein